MDATVKKRIPINVKVKAIPATIARGRNLLPTDPDKTAGRIGRTHGVANVAMPAIKTRIMGGATDIY